MMKSRWRSVALALILVLIAAISFGCLRNEYIRCMGVRVITPEQAAAYTDYAYQDLSSLLLMDGRPAAVDVEHSTLYISQNPAGKKTYRDLDGQLQISSGRYQLYFVLEREDLQLEQAMAQNAPFRLLVTDGSTRYMEYDVIFTSLPILRLNHSDVVQDEQMRTVLVGDLCLWDGLDEESGQYAVKSTTAQWHVRGNSSVALNKKSWKISLIGDNYDFIGLGRDDDWILNGMGFDDTLLRERLFMQLWNEWSQTTQVSPMMSRSEYVEVIIDGGYMGVYMLQRRIDEKYLGMDNADLLFKGAATYIVGSPEEAYEIVYSSFSDAITYDQIRPIYEKTGSDLLAVENLTDINLFLQFAQACDNYSFKNIYHLLKMTSEGYRHYLIPWDTDMTFGVTWQDGIVCDYADALDDYNVRIETDMVEDMEERLATRWVHLRETVLSQKNIDRYLDEALGRLDGSGAAARNRQTWVAIHGGVDTIEGMRQFIVDRLAWLDDYYANMNR